MKIMVETTLHDEDTAGFGSYRLIHQKHYSCRLYPSYSTHATGEASREFDCTAIKVVEDHYTTLRDSQKE